MRPALFISLVIISTPALTILAQTGMPDKKAEHESMRIAAEWSKKAKEQAGGDRTLLRFNYAMLAVKNLLSGTQLSEKYLLFAYGTHLDLLSQVDTLLVNYHDRDSRLLLIRNLHPVYERAIQLGYLLYRQHKSESYFREAFLLVEKSRNLTLDENIRSSGALGGLPPSVTELRNKLSAQTFVYRNMLDAENRKASPDAARIRLYSDSLYLTTAQTDSLQAYIKKEYPNYHKLTRSPDYTDAAAVEKSIKGSKKAVIEYFCGDSAIFMFIFSPSGTAWECTRKDAFFDSTLTAFQRSIIKSDRAEFAGNAFSLYELIFSPAEKLLEGCTHVRVIPDKYLALIPFECLLKTRPERSQGYSSYDYLLRHYVISYSTGVTQLTRNQAHKAGLGNTSLIAFAPVFSEEVKSVFRNCSTASDPLYLQLSEQRWSLKLAEKLKEQFQGEIKIKNEATASAFRQQTAQSGIIHIASHTFADASNPMNTRIAFSKDGCDTSRSNGYIFSRDLYGMQFNASLSVLGSCNTGFGTFSEGDGMLSLAHAFSYAGCPAMVYTLWEVDEKASTELLENFYAEIRRGLQKDEALHQAKLKLLEKKDETLSNPYYWAGFVFSGNEAALEFSRPSKYKGVVYVLGIAVLSALIAFLAARRMRKSRTSQ